jgi:hypothetical protein
MAKMVVNRRWSYAHDRRLIQLAASSKSVNAIADEMNRPRKRSFKWPYGWEFS